jgi:hypothetical protein
MFITCRKKVKFTHPDNASVAWEMNPGFIGDVPQWVENHWYFGKLCADGSITAIVSKRDRDIRDAFEVVTKKSGTITSEQDVPSNPTVEEQPKEPVPKMKGKGNK